MNFTENSWMISRMPFFNISKIQELMRQGPPIYSYYKPHYEVTRNYHDIDPEENREDESEIEVRPPDLNQFIRGIESESEFVSAEEDGPPEDGASHPYTGLSGDSLAFTLVYVSVFTLTLLYIGIRLARKWRKKHQQAALQTQGRISEDSVGHIPLPPCGHALCAQAARGSSLLPFTWVGVAGPAAHDTAACRGRCAACRSLAQPPPTYSKLFEEEQPPQYNDSLVIKEEVFEQEEELPTVPSDANSDSVIIDIEDDEEEERQMGQEEHRKQEEDKTCLNQDSLSFEIDRSYS